jgi:hypothetical protein
LAFEFGLVGSVCWFEFDLSLAFEFGFVGSVCWFEFDLSLAFEFIQQPGFD